MSVDQFKIVADKILEYSKSKKVNLIIPTITLLRVPGSIFVPDLEEVRISTDFKDKEIYNGSPVGNGKDKLYRFHKNAYEKFAQGANIQWDSGNSGPINVGSNTVGYQATGGIFKSSGLLQMVTDYKDINLDVELDILNVKYDLKRRDWDVDKKNSWPPNGWKKMTETMKSSLIADKIKKEHLQARIYAPEKCTSGARERVIKALLPDIGKEFTMEQLRKPFMILVFRPDLNHENPRIKSKIEDQQLLAAGCIFGPGTGGSQPRRLNAPTVQEVEMVEPTDDLEAPDAPIDIEPSKPTDTGNAPDSSMIETYFDSTDHENKIRMVDEFIVKKGYDKNQLGDGKDLNHEAWKQPGRLKNLFNHLIALPDLGEGIPPY